MLTNTAFLICSLAFLSPAQLLGGTPRSGNDNGPKVDAFVRMLSTTDDTAWPEQAKELLALGEDVVPLLLVALCDERPLVNIRARKLLQELPATAKHHLREHYSSLRAFIRDLVAELIFKTYPHTVQGHLDALQDEIPAVRWCAARALAKAGPTTLRDVLRVMLEMPPDTTEAALRCLRHQNGTEGYLSELKRIGTTDEDAVVREMATLLADSYSDDSYDQFLSLLKHANPALRAFAASKLGTHAVLAPEGTIVPHLLHALGDNSLAVRRSAVRSLGVLGQAGVWKPDVIQALADVVRHDVDAQVAACEALERYGEAAAPAIPALILALKSEREQNRSAAAAVLGSIGEKASAAAPALGIALHDESPEVACFASLALYQMLT